MKYISCKSKGYGDGADIYELFEEECDVCHTTKKVIGIDTSDGEYAMLSICQECANDLFKE